MAVKTFNSLYEAARRTDVFKAEKVILDFTSELYQLMKKQGMTKTEVARLLGKSQAYVTKVFRGDANFTIETMVRLTAALGGSVHIQVTECESEVQWFGLVQGRVISAKPVFSKVPDRDQRERKTSEIESTIAA